CAEHRPVILRWRFPRKRRSERAGPGRVLRWPDRWKFRSAYARSVAPLSTRARPASNREHRPRCDSRVALALGAGSRKPEIRRQRSDNGKPSGMIPRPSFIFLLLLGAAMTVMAADSSTPAFSFR